jgi:hypothetical protein
VRVKQQATLAIFTEKPTLGCAAKSNQAVNCQNGLELKHPGIQRVTVANFRRISR